MGPALALLILAALIGVLTAPAQIKANHRSTGRVFCDVIRHRNGVELSAPMGKSLKKRFQGPDLTPFKKAKGILYHYCSNASFLSIIENRELRASEYSLSNDRLEGKWFRKVFEDFCDDRGLSASQLQVVLRMYDALFRNYGFAGVCLSEDGDVLSQWRAYSDNGAGVSIGFDSAGFYEEPVPPNPPALPPLSKVIYDVKTQRQIVAPNVAQIVEFFKTHKTIKTDKLFAWMEKSVLEATKSGGVGPPDEATAKQMKDIEVLYYSVLTFLPLLYNFKNPAFQEKREWRGGNFVGLLSVTNAVATELTARMQKELTPDLEARRREEIGWGLHNVDYRALPDRIVPYRSFRLEPETRVIREVVIGPRNITPILNVAECLRRYGWSKCCTLNEIVREITPT